MRESISRVLWAPSGPAPFEKRAFDKGSRMELVVRGPAQVCKRCGRPFLPAPTGSRDDYYRELAEVIALAVSKDFLYE